MAEGRAPVLVRTALGGSEYVAAVLDGARPDQDVPMGLAGLLGERSRNGDERAARFRERSIERGKAEIVADRQSEPAPGQIGRHRAVARLEAVRFTIALAAGEIDVEHVDLVVARHDLTCGIDQERAISGALRRNLDGERADVQPDAERARELAQTR